LKFDGGVLSLDRVVRLADPIVYLTSDLHYHCYWTYALMVGNLVVNVVGHVVVEVVGWVMVAVLVVG
jgi:hypothetical protein